MGEFLVSLANIIPMTGDEALLTMWIIIMCAAAGLIFAVIVITVIRMIVARLERRAEKEDVGASPKKGKAKSNLSGYNNKARSKPRRRDAGADGDADGEISEEDMHGTGSFKHIDIAEKIVDGTVQEEKEQQDNILEQAVAVKQSAEISVPAEIEVKSDIDTSDEKNADILAESQTAALAIPDSIIKKEDTLDPFKDYKQPELHAPVAEDMAEIKEDTIDPFKDYKQPELSAPGIKEAELDKILEEIKAPKPDEDNGKTETSEPENTVTTIEEQPMPKEETAISKPEKPKKTKKTKKPASAVNEDGAAAKKVFKASAQAEAPPEEKKSGKSVFKLGGDGEAE